MMNKAVINAEEKSYEVLIVDDIPKNLQIIGDILYKEGLGITIATNGQQAIDIAGIKLPDLILLDVAMPDLDGYTVCEMLKNNAQTKHIPIIFLTAKAYPGDVARGFNVGAVDYITKPFNSTELLSRVKTHLELKRKREQTELMNQLLEGLVAERTSQLEETNVNLTKTNNKLSHALEKVSKLDKAKNDFITLINHELRTPLNVIMGFSQVLNTSLTSPEQSSFIERITTSAQRLVDLSETALLITSLQADSYKKEIRYIYVNNCIDEIILSLSKDIDQKKLIVINNIQSKKITISFDERLFFKCVSIVLINAIESSPEGGRILINTYIDGDHVIIEITDKGEGFPKEVLEQLFEFFTTKNIDYHTKGFGLGLATAKLIMNTLSGKIEVENGIDKGASVKLIFEKGNDG